MSKQHNWGYSSDLIGPNEWPKYFNTGQHQSPINILVNNCRHVTQSTCCHQVNRHVQLQQHQYHQNQQQQEKSKHSRPANHEARLHDRLRNSLQVGSSHHRRAHLDSVGSEDHHRSPSTSSSGSNNSSTSSSPDNKINNQNNSGGSSGNNSSSNNSSDYDQDGSCDDEDDYEGDYDEERDKSKGRYKSSSSSSPTSSETTTIRFNDDKRKQRQQHNHQTDTCCVTQVQNTRHCVSRKKIFLGYPRYLNTMQLCNTGHNWQVNLPPELAIHTLLSGPPLGDREYRLAQFHCHWGKDCDHGSEHQINGKSFAAEIHFVHWNCTDFNSFEEASKHKHGLAVLAVLIQALDGEHNQNKHLEKIINGLRKIHKPNSSLSINARLDLKKLFPVNRWSYASYEGSLTTPPLSEVVDWIVFLNPIQCSTNQIAEFRHIRCPTSGASSHQLLNNCRPVQPLNDRLVSIWTHH